MALSSLTLTLLLLTALRYYIVTNSNSVGCCQIRGFLDLAQFVGIFLLLLVDICYATLRFFVNSCGLFSYVSVSLREY